MSREQREYHLRQQLKAIQQELGETSGEQAEVDELRRRMEESRTARRRAQGSRARAGPPGTPSAGRARLPDDAFLRRADPRAALDRTETQRQSRPGPRPPRARRGPLRPEGDQGTDHRTTGRAQAQPRRQGAHPLLRRPAGRRQNVARPVDRPGVGAQVRADEPGRHARRIGAARTSPHVHRRHARPHSAGHSPLRRAQPALDAGRSRQAGARLSRRSFGGAVGDSRSGAEPRVSRQLPEPAVRLVANLLHRHGQHARHDSPAAAGSDGNPPAYRLQRGGEDANRPALPDRAAIEANRTLHRTNPNSRRYAASRHHTLHARGRRPPARTLHRPVGPQGRRRLCRAAAANRRRSARRT